MNVQWTKLFKLLAENNTRHVDMMLKSIKQSVKSYITELMICYWKVAASWCHSHNMMKNEQSLLVL